MERILIVSYLHQLRIADRPIFIFVLGSIFFQLFLTFAKLEVTPFFLYGMYSENIAVTDTFSIIKIMVNDKPLSDYASPLRERDLLETTATNYEEMKSNNNTDVLKTRIEKRYPFIYNSFLYPFVSRRIYNSPKAQDNYRSWLKRKCLNIAGTADGKVQIVRITAVLKIIHVPGLFYTTFPQLNPIKNERLEDL